MKPKPYSHQMTNPVNPFGGSHISIRRLSPKWQRDGYTRDNLKSIIFSATDAMYDLLVNPGFSIANTQYDAHRFAEHLGVGGRMDDVAMDILLREMSPDMVLTAFAGRKRNNWRPIVRPVLSAWGHDVYHIIQYFNGGFFDIGRLHPNQIATDGVKQSYLFLHERHPKSKMNEVINLSLIPCVIEDAYHLTVQDEYLSKDAEGDLRKAGRLKNKVYELNGAQTKKAKELKEKGLI